MDAVVLKKRDQYSLEIKARYLLDRSVGATNEFELQVAFFLPPTLNVSRDTYEPESLFQQLRCYLRFDTPEFTTEELTDSASETSPLARMERVALRFRHAGVEGINPGGLIHEAKMFGAVYKTMLRDYFRYVHEEAEHNRKIVAVGDRLKELTEPAKRFHELVDQIGVAATAGDPSEQNHQVSSWLEQLRMVDEHVSLLVEKYYAAILSIIESYDYQSGQSDAMKDLNRIAKTLFKEEQRRRTQGYPSTSENADSRAQLEDYVYREKSLKQFVSQVLFFRVKRRNTAKRVEHVLYAAAAGIAMVVATGIAFFGQTRFGNLSGSLFALLVVGYMLKDRAKDLFREVLKQRFGRYFSARASLVKDEETGRRIAKQWERVSFHGPNFKDRIIQVRSPNKSQELPQVNPEEILLYEKRLRLAARAIARTHRRIRGIADINVVDLAPFVRQLGIQRGIVPVVEDKNTVELRRARRVYHLNVVIRYSHPSGEEMRRFRLVVDGAGVRRIETPDGLTSHPIRLTASPRPIDDAQEED